MPEGMILRGDKRVRLKVEGMREADDAEQVRHAIENVSGARQALIEVETGSVEVVIDESVNETVIVGAIEHLGYSAKPARE